MAFPGCGWTASATARRHKPRPRRGGIPLQPHDWPSPPARFTFRTERRSTASARPALGLDALIGNSYISITYRASEREPPVWTSARLGSFCSRHRIPFRRPPGPKPPLLPAGAISNSPAPAAPRSARRPRNRRVKIPHFSTSRWFQRNRIWDNPLTVNSLKNLAPPVLLTRKVVDDLARTPG